MKQKQKVLIKASEGYSKWEKRQILSVLLSSELGTLRFMTRCLVSCQFDSAILSHTIPAS